MKYMRRNSSGIEVIEEGMWECTSSLKRYLNERCMLYGSTYDGRIAAAKSLLQSQGLVPLFIHCDEILVFTKNIRNWDVILVNYKKILSVSNGKQNSVIIVFDDLSKLSVDVSFNRFMKQVRMASILSNRFD